MGTSETGAGASVATAVGAAVFVGTGVGDGAAAGAVHAAASASAVIAAIDRPNAVSVTMSILPQVPRPFAALVSGMWQAVQAEYGSQYATSRR